MDSFELSFACRMADDSLVPLIRVIAAPDLRWAHRIGTAMLGELVGSGQWLDHLTGAAQALPIENRAIELSMGTPRLLSYLPIWLRVLHMLGLSASGVKWVYSWRIGLPTNPRGHRVPDLALTEPEIVGFFLWPREVDNGS